MLAHQLQPWSARLPFEIMPLSQASARQCLQDNQHAIRIGIAAFNLIIAKRLIQQIKLKGHNGVPEGLVAHWLKPTLDIINVSETTHV